jgi:hypothetical protein
MSILIPDTNEITRFGAAFADQECAAAIAPQMNCVEVDALAGMLRAIGEMATADLWIQEHAATDGAGDKHSRASAEEYVVPVDPMDDLQCDSCQ